LVPGPNLGYKAATDWFYDRSKSGGGVLLDQGVHLVDLVRYLLGEVVDGSAILRTPYSGVDVDLLATCMLRLRNGAVCNLNLSWVNNYTEDSILIQGAGGSLLIEPSLGLIEEIRGERNAVRHAGLVGYKTAKYAWRYLSGRDESACTHRRLIDSFVNSIIQAESPNPSGFDGYRAVKILNDLYDSSSWSEPVT
jgi:predicted dehydrogenase